MCCENRFCIYWEEHKCLLGEVTLDLQGCCRECVYVDISLDALAEERARAREGFSGKEQCRGAGGGVVARPPRY